MNDKTKWHGLSDEQWLGILDEINWRHEISETLYEIAQCSKASPEDRLSALQAINEGVQLGLLPVDVSFAYITRDVMTAIARGKCGGSDRVRRRMSERLMGARCLLRTAGQFIQKPPLTVEDLGLGLLS